MKKKIFIGFILVLFSFSIYAQEEAKASKWNVDNGIDLVSAYLFRGVTFDAHPQVQGWAALSSGNFSLGLWGTANMEGTYVETNVYMTYTAGNFGIALTDYHAGLGQKFYHFEDKNTLHTLDLTLSYSLSGSFPLSFELSSLIWGFDPKNTKFDANGNLTSYDNGNFSTYFGLGYPLSFKETSVQLTMGAILGESYWYGADEAGIINMGVKSSKTFKISETFSFTGFFQLVTNPLAEQTMVAVGVNF